MNRTALVVTAALLAVGLSVVEARPARANSLPLEARYDVDARLEFDAGRLSATTSVRVTNRTGHSVGQLTFNLPPLRVAGATVGEVSQGGRPLSHRIDDQSLIVTLPAPLGAGASTTVRIGYSGALRSVTADKSWYFSKANGIVTAYRWIPWLSRATAFQRPNIGTPLVTATSPSVTVRLRTDRALKVATSGRRTGGSKLAHTFVATNVRDFNFSASPSYRVRRERITGVNVTLLTVNYAPNAILPTARRALAHYRQRVGAYPYGHFTIAETPGRSSMESPAMVWIGQKRRGPLDYLVAHEIAHQWFYGAVGSDQADEPFADEAPTELLTRDLLGTRRKSRCASTRLDQTIYAYSKRCYYEVIYVQGSNYLDDYRRRVGEARFWSGMRAYYRQHRFGMGGTRQLLDALDAAAAPAGGGHAARFPRYY